MAKFIVEKDKVYCQLRRIYRGLCISARQTISISRECTVLSETSNIRLFKHAASRAIIFTGRIKIDTVTLLLGKISSKISDAIESVRHERCDRDVVCDTYIDIKYRRADFYHAGYRKRETDVCCVCGKIETITELKRSM